MARASRKYKRYIPKYHPELRYRQTTCNVAFLAAYFDALDTLHKTGQSKVAIRGFGGWHVARITKADLEFEAC